MDHDILHYARKRHTTKAYDASKTIPDETADKLKELLRLSPSSTNLQPWHFIVASTPEGKARVAKSTEEKFPFNSPSIHNASHVVVFASKLAVSEDFFAEILDQEEKDGRFDAESDDIKTERKTGMDGARKMFFNIHQQGMKDAQHWMDKQVYLNMGQFMLGAAALGLDTTPMEGIDTAVLDEEFGLREKGFNSLAIVCVGYHDPQEDYNAALTKSRLPLSTILTEV
ncbi:oxygen-insensitive NAD(P)H-dependent nitroreductase NfsB [Hellea balneolensis]|uniref:oxygen-insensitive NAD(P)H-dependent nitroreductase NfsB n=1 Tax=Hellea balneolensis TaxID=287478 RepID=UPI000426A61C